MGVCRSCMENGRDAARRTSRRVRPRARKLGCWLVGGWDALFLFLVWCGGVGVLGLDGSGRWRGGERGIGRLHVDV